MASRYTGAWARRSQSPPSVALKPPLDARHLSPPPGTDQSWVQATAAPALPDELDGVQGVIGYAGGGPVNLTPWDHDDGQGVGHGLSTLEAQDQRGEFHSVDRGAYAESTWNVQVARDGAYHVDIIPDTDGDGDSPATLVYRQPGVGSPIDPFARRGRRVWRWRDRWIDRHFFEAQPHPSAVRNAYTAPVKAPQADGNQYTSQFVSGTIEYNEPFVAPQNRVSPRPWDQPMTGNGIDPNASSYGLTTWGL